MTQESHSNDAWMDAPPERARDPWFAHLFRFLGLYFLIVAANVILVGFILLLGLLDRTGRRKRDLILTLIPLLNIVVVFQTLWRSTARSVYWSPRDDRPSSPLQGGVRTGMIVIGWILGILMIGLATAGIVTADSPSDTGWTRLDRDVFIAELEGDDVDRATAECVANRIEARYPEGPDSMPNDEAALQSIGSVMFQACASD